MKQRRRKKTTKGGHLSGDDVSQGEIVVDEKWREQTREFFPPTEQEQQNLKNVCVVYVVNVDTFSRNMHRILQRHDN